MIEINLLGTTKTKSKIKSYGTKGDKGNLLTLIMIAIVVIEVIVLALYTLHLNNKVDILTQKRNSLRNVEREVRVIKAKLKQVQLMTTTIKNLEKGRGIAYRNLKDIADVMPNGLWLVKVDKKGKTIRIEGKSFTTEAVAQYMTNLGNLKDVSKVNFDSRGLVRLSSNRGGDVYRFYIAVFLKD